MNKEKIDLAFNSLVDSPSDLTFAHFFLELATFPLFCHNLEKSKCYYFNSKTTLYEEIGKAKVAVLIQNVLHPFFDKALKEANYIMAPHIRKYIKKIESTDPCINIAKSVMGLCECDDFLSEKADESRDTINFKNGLVNLRTGVFRERTKDDTVTKCLDYDYSPERYPEIEKEIMNDLSHIWNDDDKVIQARLKWDGYCLTGETYAKKALFDVGVGGNNGKTTHSDINCICFPIYCTKFNKDIFNNSIGESRKYKNLWTAEKPVRQIIIEEMNKDIDDTSGFKEFVDGKFVTMPIMHTTKAGKMKIFAKMTGNSNDLPNFKVDNGMRNRIYLNNLLNTFVDAGEYNKLKAQGKTKNVRLKDMHIIEKYQNVKYKLSFFHIILPYSIQMYKQGGYTEDDFTIFRENFEELYNEIDVMKNFINHTYEITNDDNDRIYKGDFEACYREYTQLFKVHFRSLLNDIKRIGLKYAKNLRVKNTNKMGVVLGIKLKNQNDEIKDDLEYGVKQQPEKKEKVKAFYENNLDK